MKQVGIGLIGAGTMGTYGHYPGYVEIPDKARVVAVCDSSKSALERFAGKGPKAYTDYLELLKDPEVDAVDICLPHFLHARVALAAINAGKHVIVEKPFTMDLKEGDAVIAAAKERNLKLMAAENMRFVKAYEVAKSLVESGEIGEICYARAYTGGPSGRLMDPNDWRGKLAEAGGGTMMDDGIHCFYLFRWIVGEVKSVYAITMKFTKDSPREVEDNAVGTLRFANGAKGIFAFSNTTASPWTQQLELYGTGGSILVDFLSHQPVRVFSAKRKLDELPTRWSYYGNVSWQEPFIEHAVQQWATASMRVEVKHFVDCILENKEPWVTGEDGKKSVEIVLKAYESAKLGREVEI